MADIVLETPRLRLRPFAAEDSADLYAYARDPAVGPPAGWPPHESYMESWYIVQTVFSQPHVFAVELKDRRKVIGSIGFVGGHGTQMDGYSQAYLSGSEQARYMLLDMKEGK